MKLLIIALLLSGCSSLIQPARYKIDGCLKSLQSVKVLEDGDEMYRCEKW